MWEQLQKFESSTLNGLWAWIHFRWLFHGLIMASSEKWISTRFERELYLFLWNMSQVENSASFELMFHSTNMKCRNCCLIWIYVIDSDFIIDIFSNGVFGQEVIEIMNNVCDSSFVSEQNYCFSRIIRFIYSTFPCKIHSYLCNRCSTEDNECFQISIKIRRHRPFDIDKWNTVFY